MRWFVDWYNHEHLHSAIQFVTPAQRRAGRDADILARREQVYRDAKSRHPQRWSGEIRNWKPVGDVHLNPAKDTTEIKTNKVA
ncbi:MAG: putative transposase [Gammaproteobacteria bacterium]